MWTKLVTANLNQEKNCFWATQVNKKIKTGVLNIVMYGTHFLSWKITSIYLV